MLLFEQEVKGVWAILLTIKGRFCHSKLLRAPINAVELLFGFELQPLRNAESVTAMQANIMRAAVRSRRPSRHVYVPSLKRCGH